MIVVVGLLAGWLAWRPGRGAARSVVTAKPVASVTPEAEHAPSNAAPAEPEAAQDAGTSEIEHEVGTTAPRAKQPAPAAASGLQLRHVGGFSLVHLGGGEPAIRPFGTRDKAPVRTVRGRVIDQNGSAVAGAIVLANPGFNVRESTVMARASAVTDASGHFTIDDAPAANCQVVALLQHEWSDVVEAGDAPIELRMHGHGSLTGTFTYDGGPETFHVYLRTPDKVLSAQFQSDALGHIEVTDLPPGIYNATVGLAQSFGHGQSQTQTREIVISAGKTTELELAFKVGTTVAMDATPPPGTTPKGLTYWLFAKDAPRDGEDARTRKLAENAPSMSVGGGSRLDAVEMHDISAGSYWACAAFFDAATMDAMTRPFGCRRVEVRDGDAVVEVSIPLVP
jgi:hypothetical protein